MLIELAIRDFAIIDELRIAFEPGLNALTGETGAGKSIIIDALGAVLGERIGADVVRQGAKAAIVEAHYDISHLEGDADLHDLLVEQGIEPEDGMLILSREINAAGRSTARINGRATTATLLGLVGAHLVDIHGQSDHLSLLRPAYHIELIDRYAGLLERRRAYADHVRTLRGVRAQIESLTRGAREREQRVDLLAFQVKEIDEAALQPGEEDELLAERARLANAERLAEDAATAYALLSGGDGDEVIPAVTALKQVAVRLAEIAQMDPSMTGLSSRLNEVTFLLEDIAAEVRDYRDVIEADPVRLETIEERLDLIKRLKRKYGATIDEIIVFGASASRELEALTGGEADVSALATREQELLAVIGAEAGALSAARRVAGDRFARAVEAAISELNMGRAHFEVGILQVDDPDGAPVNFDGVRRVAFDETGADRIEFLLAPNAGESLKPLARVASGGETARLMLALKSILAAADSTPTLVFDEVDVGVGGRSGQVVGEKLWSLSSGHQVIVITHLSQIAAFATTHFRIQKGERAGRTISTIEQIDGSERIDEIAAMFDGIPATDESRAAARQLLERIRIWKEEHALV